MDTITKEIIETFRHIEVWNLIDFSDVADIARSEIQKKHTDQSGNGALTPDGNALMSLLNAFQNTVLDIIPDVADTILSRPLIRKMIEKIKSDGTGLGNELASAIESVGEKSQEWKREAVAWVEGFRDSVDPTQSTPVSLLALLQYVHELLDQVVSPSAMADRVKSEADAKEAAYRVKVNEWQSICKEIENDNESIRQQNKRREDLIAEVTRQFETEMSAFERQVREYQEEVEQKEALAASAAGTEILLPTLPAEPVRPTPLEPRVDKIRRENPPESEKGFPPEPKPEPTLHYYTELRDLLYDKLSEMKERERNMAETFARRVLRLQAEGLGAIGEIDINTGDDFLQHLMDSRIRTLGKLLPRISRVFLRDPKIPGLLYLVSYEHYGDGLTVSIGSTFLR